MTISTSGQKIIGPIDAIYRVFGNKTKLGIDPQIERFAQGLIMHLCRNSDYAGFVGGRSELLFNPEALPLSFDDLSLLDDMTDDEVRFQVFKNRENLVRQIEWYSREYDEKKEPHLRVSSELDLSQDMAMTKGLAETLANQIAEITVLDLTRPVPIPSVPLSGFR